MWGLRESPRLAWGPQNSIICKRAEKADFYQQRSPHSCVPVAVRHIASSPYDQEFSAEVKDNFRQIANSNSGDGRVFRHFLDNSKVAHLDARDHKQVFLLCHSCSPYPLPPISLNSSTGRKPDTSWGLLSPI